MKTPKVMFPSAAIRSALVKAPQPIPPPQLSAILPKPVPAPKPPRLGRGSAMSPNAMGRATTSGYKKKG